jgi:hypothetical protein
MFGLRMKVMVLLLLGLATLGVNLGDRDVRAAACGACSRVLSDDNTHVIGYGCVQSSGTSCSATSTGCTQCASCSCGGDELD